MDLINLTFRSWICKSYENTKFLLTSICEKYPSYKIFLGILYYEIGEYKRSLDFLNGINSITSVYYECLCMLKLTNESKSIQLLEKIIENQIFDDVEFGNQFDIFLIRKTDLVFIVNLLAESYVQNFNSVFALPFYQKAHKMFPLYSSFFVLINENDSGLNDFIKNENFLGILGENYDKKSLKYNHDDNKNCNMSGKCVEFDNENILKIIKEFYIDCKNFVLNWDKKLILKYKTMIPGIGSYFLGYAGKVLSDLGKMRMCAHVFDNLRTLDPTFIENMDVYSTCLWQQKNTLTLGILSKDVIKLNRLSHISWLVLGNYFSQYGDHSRAIICIKRSIIIKKTHYGYALLGHESLMKSDYSFSAECFQYSIKMCNTNYNAHFGLGIVESKLGDFLAANKHFRISLKINPHNKMLKFIYLQVLNRYSKYSEAVKFLRESYLLESKNLDKEYVIQLIKILRKSHEDIDEYILLELVDILINYELLDLAKLVLESVCGRNRLYYVKKNMLDVKMVQMNLGNINNKPLNEYY